MATVKFYLKNPKDADGFFKSTEVGIYARLTITKQERFELATGEQIIPKHWDSEKQQAKNGHRHHVELNLSLRRIQDIIIQVWRENKTSSAAEIRALCIPLLRFTPAEEKKTLVQIVDEFIVQYATEKEASSVQKYQNLRKRLNEFAPGMSAEDANMIFFDKFKAFLYAIPNPNYITHSLHFDSSGGFYRVVEDDSGIRIGLFDEVVFKYIINLKTVLAWAEEREIEVNTSYRKVKVIRRDYEVISLTRNELQALEEADFRDSARQTIAPGATNPERELKRRIAALEVARDYLVAECRTGQRVGDILRISPDQVKDNKWTIHQKKGSRMIKKVVTVPFVGFCAPAYWIFQKHNFKMPKVYNQNLNENIKLALKLSGVNQEMFIERWAGNKRIRIYGPKYEFISTHTGRKTFITIALQSMPHKVVMDLTGIRSFKTLKHYMGESEQETLEKYLNEIGDGRAMMKKAN